MGQRSTGKESMVKCIYTFFKKEKKKEEVIYRIKNVKFIWTDCELYYGVNGFTI